MVSQLVTPSRLVETVWQKFYIKGLEECSVCSFNIARIYLWGLCNVDVTCVKSKKVMSRRIHAVTIFNNATWWPKIGKLEDKTACHVAKQFDYRFGCVFTQDPKWWSLTIVINLLVQNFRSYFLAMQSKETNYSSKYKKQQDERMNMSNNCWHDPPNEVRAKWW